MRHASIWTVLALLGLAGCGGDSETPAEPAQVATPTVAEEAAPEQQAEAQAPGEEANVVEAGEDVSVEAGSSKEIVLASVEIPAASATKSFKAGKEYAIVKPAQPTGAEPGQVEVTEFFMYTCPHCFSFEPYIKAYEANKPSYVNIVQVPVMFNAVAQLHAKAYYAAEALGVLEKTHQPMFEEIHLNRNMLSTEDALAGFFAEHAGVDRAEFLKTFNSFGVESKVRKAASLAQRYQVSSVPNVFVAGKYRTSGNMVGSYEGMISVIQELAEAEHAGP